MKKLDRLLSHLAAIIRAPSITGTAGDPDALIKAMVVVQYFYYAMVFLATLSLMERISLSQDVRLFDTVWPVFWVRSGQYLLSNYLIITLYIVTSLTGALFFRHRIGRLVAFIGILELHALVSSFGKSVHQLAPWLYTAFLFIFLPDLWDQTNPATNHKKEFLLNSPPDPAVFDSSFAAGAT